MATYCSKCGGETVRKEGVSKKTGKPWVGFKCLEDGCGNMDFVRVTPQQPSVVTGQKVVQNGISGDKDKLIIRQSSLKVATETIKQWIDQRPSGDLLGESTLAQLTCNVADIYVDWVYDARKTPQINTEESPF